MSDNHEPHEYDPGVESGAAAGVTDGDEEVGEGLVGGSTYGADDLEDDEDDDAEST
jgi:hypothetical protein